MPKHSCSKTELACMDVPQMEENNMAKYRKLSRTSDQRKALLRNQVTNLLYNGKIVTTEAKAKEIRKIAESLIAMAVREKDNFETVTVTAKVARKDADGKRVKEVPTKAAGKKKNTKDIDMTKKMFEEIAPKYADRNGGYTRIVKIGPRKGDAAMEVLIELV